MAAGNISITVDGVDLMVETLNAVAAQIATLTMKVDQLMTSAAEQAASISGDIANTRADIGRLQQSATDAQSASTAALEQLQTTLDGVVADRDAEIQRQVSEAVAAANTEISNQFAAVVQEARDLANIVPDPAAPTEPTNPEQPTPPVEPTEPTEPVTPDEPAPPVQPENPVEPEQPVEPTNPTPDNPPVEPTPDNPPVEPTPDNPPPGEVNV